MQTVSAPSDTNGYRAQIVKESIWILDNLLFDKQDMGIDLFSKHDFALTIHGIIVDHFLQESNGKLTASKSDLLSNIVWILDNLSTDLDNKTYYLFQESLQL
jgi:hypothetical protein